MYKFDTKVVKNDCVQWIRDWMTQNGDGCNCVVGISGGTDSSVVAALCVEAFGKDSVLGVLMPCGIQKDIDVAQELCEFLDIHSVTINIGDTVKSLLGSINSTLGSVSQQTLINLPARVRMTTLYGVSQTVNGRVINTSNLSEDWIGFSTRYGDSVGDASPLSKLTKQEVKAIGRELGLPENFIEKVPADGLCGKTDEENFGFSYEVLDKYIREGVIDDVQAQERIEELHFKNGFKMQPMPVFYPHNGLSSYEED